MSGGGRSSDDSNITVGRRFLLDKKMDTMGVRLLQICKETNVKILDGRVDKDKEVDNVNGLFVLGTSAIAYVLLSPAIFDIANSFIEHDITVFFSNHASIHLLYFLVNL